MYVESSRVISQNVWIKEDCTGDDENLRTGQLGKSLHLLFLCLFNLLIWQNEASTLDPKKRITQYDIRVYKARDGLPMNALKDVFQSSDGYIWIARQEGLARFDGVRFNQTLQS